MSNSGCISEPSWPMRAAAVAKGGSWRQVRTWKTPHLAAVRVSGDLGATVAELRREPTNHSDPNAVQVLLDGQPIGYVEAGEAAHLQTAFETSPEPVVVPIRRARHKRSPLFDVFIPESHPVDVRIRDVCKMEAGKSRDHIYGALNLVEKAPAIMATRS